MRKILRLVQKEGLDNYVETSALNGVEDVDRVFKEAIRVAIGCDTNLAAEKDDIDGNKSDTNPAHQWNLRRWLCLE